MSLALRKRFPWIAGGAIVLVLGVGGWRILAPLKQKRDDRLRYAMAQDQMHRLGVALETYRKDNRFYPTTEQGIDALVKPSKIPPIPRRFYAGGYINRISIPRDPWGRVYMYEGPAGGQSFSIRSKGKVGWYQGDDLIYSSGATE